jgi:ABC-type branched-subunit amino acid transport system substrate-binding protein
MAIEDFGGSVIGLQIEVLIADHQNKPDIGAAIIRKWYDEDGGEIVVDISHSGVALAVQDGLEVAQGLTFATAFYWDRTDATRKFAKRFRTRQSVMPTIGHAADYSAVTHYLKAVAATGTRETGPVLAQMRATPVQDFYCENGRLRVDGRLMHDMYLTRVKQSAQSK